MYVLNVERNFTYSSTVILTTIGICYFNASGLGTNERGSY